jgi:predicted nucleic acid-binding protein
VLYEVPKILLLRQSKTLVDLFVSEVLRRVIIPLDEQLAFLAAELTIAHQLSMADALIYATAQAHRALLITSDTHFANLPGVKLI